MTTHGRTCATSENYSNVQTGFQAIVLPFFFFFFSFHVGGIKNVFNCSCTTSRTGKWEDKGSTPVGRTHLPVSLTFMDLFWKYFDKLVLSKARF